MRLKNKMKANQFAFTAVCAASARFGMYGAGTVLFRRGLWMLLAVLLTLLPVRLSAQISITKLGESLVGNSAQPQNVAKPVNLRAHQDDAIVSYNGYQYCVYYSTIGANTARRYVTIGRRELPSGAWETIVFTDYIQTINDSHNIISIGICEGDGTIHLAFDHHNANLNYRISVEGLASIPQAHSWEASKFNAVQENLPGLDKESTTGLTYPRFFPKPNGDLQFVRRKGSAISGKSLLYTYSQTTHAWTSHGVCIDGTEVPYYNDAGEWTNLNGYLHGIAYDSSNRLHASWVWRTTDGNNFNFMYAYSDDHGLHWKNNTGQPAGTVNSDPMTLSNSPPVKVFDYPEGSLYNQTGQAVDSVGRVHVVQRKNGKFFHLFRNTSGSWTANETTIPQGRYKITTDQNNNVYLITPSAIIYAATPGGSFADWAVAYAGDAGDFDGDAMFDEGRMKAEGILSILAAKPGSSQEMYSIDLLVSPVIPPAPIQQDEDGGDWNAASTWDPDGIPVAGYDYTTDLNLNINDASAAFDGDSLTMQPGSSLSLRDSANTFAANNLIMTGGRIYGAAGNNVTFTLDGKMAILSDTLFQSYWDASGPRDLRILSKISGYTTITNQALSSSSTHTLFVDNADNDFSGTWVGENGTIEFANAGAVGAANVEVLPHGKLVILGRWDGFAKGASLTVADSPNALVDLGTNEWTVTSLLIGSSSVPENITPYTTAELNAVGANPVFSGTGTVRVGPPPVPPQPELLVGWERWAGGAGSISPATIQTSGITGAATNGGFGIAKWGGSNDGTFGALQTPPASTRTSEHEDGLRKPGAADIAFDFLVENTSGSNVVLGAFVFDALLKTNPNGPDQWNLQVLSGSITPGAVTTGDLDYASATADLADYDVDLTGLPDHTLNTGDRAVFRLSFTGGAVGNAGNMDMDNVALTGLFAAVPPSEPPTLDYAMSSGDMVFTWIESGFKVQGRTNLTAGTWSDVPGGDTPPVTNSPVYAEEFFRLIEQ